MRRTVSPVFRYHGAYVIGVGGGRAAVRRRARIAPRRKSLTSIEGKARLRLSAWPFDSRRSGEMLHSRGAVP